MPFFYTFYTLPQCFCKQCWCCFAGIAPVLSVDLARCMVAVQEQGTIKGGILADEVSRDGGLAS